MMTGLLRRIRAMADEKGAKRGRPFLISARVPDSPGFAKGIGLDIERWMADGLIDMVAGGGYFHFQPWEHLVTLGRRYGVPVYACLSASRITPKQIPEGTPITIDALWNAEAKAALTAGVNGVYLFNVFNPEDKRFRTLGSLETLPEEIPECAPVTGSAGSMNRWLKGGGGFVDFPE